jgi:hypothetical protein
VLEASAYAAYRCANGAEVRSPVGAAQRVACDSRLDPVALQTVSERNDGRVAVDIRQIGETILKVATALAGVFERNKRTLPLDKD